jgi:predicted aspartyl protease
LPARLAAVYEGPVRSARAASHLLAGAAAVWLVAASAVRAEPALQPPAEAVIARLPFEPDSPANRVMVDLAPDGARAWVMLLDTGASDCVITPRMARSLGVSVRRDKSSPYRKATRIGRDLQFWVDTKSSDTASKTGFEYGLLGGDFLDDYVLELDFPGRAVRLLDPEKYAVPESVDAADERVIPLTIAGTRVLAEIELHGRSVRALLDTGAPHGLLVSGKAAKKVGIDVDGLLDFGTVGTVLGPTRVRLHDTDTFSFAGFEFPTTPVVVAPRGLYNQAGPTDSIVGYDVMSQFVMRIDYARSRLWLQREPSPRVTFLGGDYALGRELGAFFSEVAPGSFQVWWVAPDGPARRYGLRADDVVLAAAGQARLTADEILRRVKAEQDLTVARLHGDVWVDLALPEPTDEVAE